MWRVLQAYVGGGKCPVDMSARIVIESHAAGILAHSEQGATNVFMKGLNRGFSSVRRKTCGDRIVRNMIDMLSFAAGKLSSQAMLGP